MKVPYGVDPDSEVWIELPTGNFFVFESKESNPNGTSYVRVVDRQGGEVAYWNCDEWAEEPEFVMGAICGSLLSTDQVDPDDEPGKFYKFGPKTKFPKGIIPQ